MKRVSICAVLLMSCLAVASRGQQDCPKGCHCSKSGSELLTVCAGGNLTLVPTDIPAATTGLYFQQNHIKTLPEGAFRHLTSLHTLVLSFCETENIHPKAFSGLTALTSLTLTWNKIKTLQSGTFSGLPALRELKLDNNDLQEIQDGAFKGVNLDALYLENNKDLSKFGSDAFKGAQVRQLDLYDSKLSSEFLGALSSLSSSLKKLHIQKNQHPLTIPEALFKDFQFEHLNLNDNGITNVAFLRNVATDNLELEGNPIGPIDFSRFSRLKTTRNLFLGNTSFHYVHGEYFRDLTFLKQLSLAHNGIRSLPASLEGVFQYLETTILDGNAFHCNCEMLWFREMLERKDATSGGVIGAMCSTPEKVKLENMSKENMTCASPDSVNISQTMSVNSKQQVALSCSAKGDPAPSIVWNKPDGTSVETSPQAQRLTDETVASISVEVAEDHKNNAYECVASNIAGNASASIQIDTYNVQKVVASASCVHLHCYVVTLPLFLLHCLLYNILGL